MTSPMERFWAKVDTTGECWIWRGAVSSTGYGNFSVDGRTERAHRHAYLLCVGAVAEGLHLDHLCRNPLCVRPSHLEPVTCRENLMRGVGPTAVNASKTHCKNGHEFTPDNTFMHLLRGRYLVRECGRLAARRRRVAVRAGVDTVRRGRAS